jgi:oxygen-independent coproporphyrinogen-3 oxidase
VYCDFAIAVRREVPVDEFIGAVERELDLRFPGTAAWPLDTLYLGGGTPSRLGADGLSRLVRVIRDRAQLNPGAEVTIEANPDDLSREGARAWRDAGVNRVSLGAQSFDNGALEWMHRVHDADAIPAAVDSLRAAGIDDISLDLIFSLPDTVSRDWRRDLELALSLDPTHVSLYGLTIEPHAPLGKRVARREIMEAPEERYEREFMLADEVLTRAGFDHYEVSNFARPGHRARHNSAYWLGVPYAGIGPGAHEFDGDTRRWNVGAYAQWVRLIDSGADPAEGSETLTPDNRVAESVYLGLRTTDGLEISEAERLHVQSWVAAGWARTTGSRLRLTATGWLRLDSLTADLTLFRSP